MTLWLWVPSESALNSLLLAFYSITLAHNVLEYTAEYTAVQTVHEFIPFTAQVLIQQSTVLGSGLLVILNEGDIDPITKYGWWENHRNMKYYTLTAFPH